MSKVLKKGAYELTNFEGNKLPEPRNGLYLKSTMLRLSAFFYILLYVFLCTIVLWLVLLYCLVIVTDFS